MGERITDERLAELLKTSNWHLELGDVVRDRHWYVGVQEALGELQRLRRIEAAAMDVVQQAYYIEGQYGVPEADIIALRQALAGGG